MTFVGSTVGAVRFNMYTGGVEARVRWAADMDTAANVGELALTLTDLESTIPAFGRIRHGAHPDSDPTHPGASEQRGEGWEEVRAITFSALIKSDMTFDNSGLASTERTLDLEYNTYNGEAAADIKGADSDGTVLVAGTPTGWIRGSFVGQDADGPLGLLGTWGIEGSTGGERDTYHWLTTGNTYAGLPLRGAFGADIAP